MSTLATSESNFSSTVVALVSRRLEEALRANYVHLAPGNYVAGNRVRDGFNALTYVGYQDLAAATTQLTEGTAPTANTLGIVIDTCTASQVGATVEITDLAAAQSPHQLFEVAANVIADNAAKTYDVLVREILNAGASVQYVTASARSLVATSNIITGAQVKKMWSILKRNNVPTFADGTYRAIVHPDAVYDLQTDTASGGWMDVWKYTDNTPLLANEIGRFGGVRFMVSSNAKVFATAGASSANVYSTVFFGPDAYVLGDMQSLSTHFVPPGGDHTDPLAQKAIVGWKGAFGCMLLDANGPRYVRLEHGTTLNLG